MIACGHATIPAKAKVPTEIADNAKDNPFLTVHRMNVRHAPEREQRQHHDPEPTVEVSPVDAGREKSRGPERREGAAVLRSPGPDAIAEQECQCCGEQQEWHDDREGLVGRDEQQHRSRQAAGECDPDQPPKAWPVKGLQLPAETNRASEIAGEDRNRARCIRRHRRDASEDQRRKGQEGSAARKGVQDACPEGGENEPHYV